MTEDVDVSITTLHCQHIDVVPLRLKFPVLSARIIISAKKIHKVAEFVLWDTQILATMILEPIAVGCHMLLCPDHVAGVVIEEEIYKSPLRVTLCAQEHMLTVFSALTGSEQNLPACKHP